MSLLHAVCVIPGLCFTCVTCTVDPWLSDTVLLEYFEYRCMFCQECFNRALYINVWASVFRTIHFSKIKGVRRIELGFTVMIKWHWDAVLFFYENMD